MGAHARGVVFTLLLAVPAGLSAAVLGQLAPDIALPSIFAGSGPAQTGALARPIRLADHRGRVVYVSFWSAWCEPCRGMLPDLGALRQDMSRTAFELLSINVDTEPHDGRRVLASHPVDHPVASDPFRFTPEDFGIDVLPAGALIDADGVLRRIYQGDGAEDLTLLRRDVEKLLMGGPGAQ